MKCYNKRKYSIIGCEQELLGGFRNSVCDFFLHRFQVVSVKMNDICELIKITPIAHQKSIKHKRICFNQICFEGRRAVNRKWVVLSQHMARLARANLRSYHSNAKWEPTEDESQNDTRSSEPAEPNV